MTSVGGLFPGLVCCLPEIKPNSSRLSTKRSRPINENIQEPLCERELPFSPWPDPCEHPRYCCPLPSMLP